MTWQPTKLNYSHEDCIDFILANPAAGRRDIAERYGRTETWVTLITNSDLFKARYAARRAEILDPELTATIKDRFNALAARGAEKLLDRIESGDASDQLLVQATALGAKAIGLGQPSPPPPTTQEDLSALAGRLVNFVRSARNGEAIDVPSRETNATNALLPNPAA